MAKVKFGMMMTDARGKLGGQVFSKNRAGSYIRTKVTPVNPRTVYQQASRFLLGNLSASWSSLTPEAIKAWNEAVEDWKKTDIFGDLKKPTGKNLYTALNKNSLQYGGSAITLPPAKLEFPELKIVSVTATSDNGKYDDIAIATSGNTTGFKIVVFSTPPIQKGISFFKNRLRYVESFAGALNVNVSLGNYTDRFGSSFPIDQKVGVELRLLAPNGQMSAPLAGSDVIEEL